MNVKKKLSVASRIKTSQEASEIYGEQTSRSSCWVLELEKRPMVD